jgi:type VI protein secretion system component Hcp
MGNAQMDTNSTIEILSEQFKPVELTDQQLDTVAGGQLDTVAGGAITKTVDAASPSLFQLCCTGKHIKSGKLH